MRAFRVDWDQRLGGNWSPQLPGKDRGQGAWRGEPDTGETLRAQEGKGIRGAQPQEHHGHLRGATGLRSCHRKAFSRETSPPGSPLREKAKTDSAPFLAELGRRRQHRSFAGLFSETA